MIIVHLGPKDEKEEPEGEEESQQKFVEAKLLDDEKRLGQRANAYDFVTSIFKQQRKPRARYS